jgi:hypothetical protein
MAAAIYSQTTTITVDKRNVTISDVFNAIEQQTEYKIFYRNDQLDISRPTEIKSGKIMVSQRSGHGVSDV